MSEEKKVYEITLDKAERHFVEKMGIPKAELSVIKKQVAPGIDNGDLLYCLQMQEETGLSIIKKELWIVPRKAKINGNWVEKHEPMIGRKGARKIAASKGFKGTVKTSCEIKDTPQLVNGKWEMKEDLVAIAELTHNDESHTIECDFSAFAGTTRDGALTTFWRKMPKIMLMKVAEFQLLDKVFGLDGLGSYEAGVINDDIEVQDGSGNVINNMMPQEKPATPKELPEDRSTPLQEKVLVVSGLSISALNEQLKPHFGGRTITQLTDEECKSILATED